ncbi:MAG: ATP-binding cassette domain-containing protein [Alphaproteobacteria bacterium]
MSSIHIKNVTLKQKNGSRTLLQNVNITLHPGEVVLLTGPSGSGKSTIVNILAGTMDPKERGWEITGFVELDKQQWSLGAQHAGMGGMVFQSFALFDDLNIDQNLSIASDHNTPPAQNLRDAIQALLDDIDGTLSIRSASGGQRQRVAVARTLLANHPILFLDEPNSGLDSEATKKLSYLLKTLAKDLHIPIVVVAHHLRHLIDHTSRLLVLDPQSASIDEIPPKIDALEQYLKDLQDNPQKREASKTQTARIHRVTTQTQVNHRAKKPSVQLDWFLYFLQTRLWELGFSPNALLFVALGSILVGFVTSWFVLMYIPFRDYILPVIYADALAGLAFTELRVMTPLTTAMLISVRNAALISADTGHKVYTDQFGAMRNLNIPHRIYHDVNILLSSTIISLALTLIALMITTYVAMMTWWTVFPEDSLYIWRDLFFQRLWPAGQLIPTGWEWILAKSIPSIVGAAYIALFFGQLPKNDVRDINRATARSLIWGLTFVLVWHSALTLVEFSYVKEKLEASF